MTCRSCGYEASFAAPTCPRCGAVAGAAPPSPPSTPASTVPETVDRTVNRAALRADMQRVAGQTTPPTLGPPTAVPAPGRHDDPWVTSSEGANAHSGGAAPPAAGPAEVLPSPPAAHRQPAQVAVGPSFTLPESNSRPATLGQRVAATVVDGGVLLLLAVPAGFVLSMMDGRGEGVATVLALLVWLVMLAYAPVLIGRSGRTIGKNVVGIEVADIASGRAIGLWRSVLRWLMLGFMGSLCYLGYLSILLDQGGWHRGWHDRAADSRVVQTSARLPVTALLKSRR